MREAVILALFFAVAVTSPFAIEQEPPRTVLVYTDECEGQVMCQFDQRRGRRLCSCEPDVVSLGQWDPRPTPDEWHRNAYEAAPAAYGAFSLEKHDP